MMTAALDPFSASALGSFATHLHAQAQRLGRDGATASSIARGGARALDAHGESGFKPLQQLLDRFDLRTRWNAELSTQRPRFLARWIGPHVVGRTLDLLCGDGAVGDAIARVTGRDVDLVERPAHRGDAVHAWTHRVRGLDAVTGPDRRRCYDTVLLSTVLHHEPDPEGFLRFAAELAARRLIIVENCIDDDYPADYQQLVDLFFNRCLNETALCSPGQHRTPDDWIELARGFGPVVARERTLAVPGIPLGHHLLVFERTRPS